MADNRKRLSELPSSSQTSGLYTLGVDAQNEGVKIPIGDLLDGLTQPTQNALSTAQAANKTAGEAKTLAQNASDKATTALGAASNASENAGTAMRDATSAINAAAAAQKTADDALSTAQAADVTASGTREELMNIINPRTFINANALLSTNQPMTLATVIGALSTHASVNYFKKSGLVVTFIGESGWESWQYIFTLRNGAIQPTFDPFITTSYWRKFGGSAVVGNCFNVTNDAPLSMGYYELETAIEVAYDKGFRNVGMQITFAIADKSWKTYQYIGADSEETTFKNPGNWIDNAGMSAGDEMFIIVDALCGPCTAAPYYTLEYAINAITSMLAKTGIDYRKSGLVISYQKDENTWDAYQFTSSVGNFGEAGLWKPFGNGGGGSDVKTFDEPKEDGTDAFSTGGAYKHIPTQFNINTETEGVVKLALANEKGEIIGEEKQFAVGTGTGGGQAGQILEFTPEESPLYGQAGGTLAVKAAITLKSGTDYESGIIEKVELYDRDTEQLLETFRLNKATSVDKETFDFEFDLSRYFSLAGQRKFRFVAYDDSDRTAKRNINVTAVDVTIKSEQTLNYTASTAINVGGQVKQLPMYRFANNASDKGILCTTEIFINGAWKTLGTATVSDTYAHSITIDPKNCCGVALKHGAYPMRIHGEDISSGVVGNYLHTAIMVVDPADATSIVVSRWYTEAQDGQVKQYESISIDFAAYSTQASELSVEIFEKVGTQSTVKRTSLIRRGETLTYIQRVQGHAHDGSVTLGLYMRVATSVTETASFKIVGTLLNIESVSAQQMFDIDFSARSNKDADKTITDSGFTLTLDGANYETNGFVKDSFGSEEYETDDDTGIMACRIAENVRGTLDYAPFNVSAIETNGLAIQFRLRTRHIADEDARLISCIANGIGFYATGNRVVFTTDNEETVAHTINTALEEDALTDVAIVIKPTSQAPYAGIGVVEMYIDGEFSGACYYDNGSLSRHATQITFDGSQADLYLYNMRAWETYYTFEQSFNNYLLKVYDAEQMIVEYNFNQVMSSQTAEGRPARNIPQMALLGERSIAYAVMCKSPNTGNTAENYPEYIEGLDGDKKTPTTMCWYFYFPETPWRNIIIYDVPTTNQGTTSSRRPIKNKKAKTKNAARIEMMYDRSQFTDAAQLQEYDFVAKIAAQKKFQVVAGTKPTNIFCIKVDYSESGGANNGASTQLYNELSRALGSAYMTPAQNYYTGEYELNPCISSIPMALYRTDANSPDPTSPSYGYFHAKGNFNHDKGDAAVFGFEDVEGYNADCLNYGDFYELIAARDQSLDAFVASQDKSTWEFNVDEKDASKGKWNVIVCSEFCGEKHRVFRRADSNSAWTETTGTMTFTGGRWRITGDVVNPVECYELKAYNDMDWFQNVSTIDDMLRLSEDGELVWLQQYESRYPDNDALNQAYEDGRKLPYRLFKWLQWCNDCNQHKTAADGNITLDGKTVAGTPENRLKKFAHELHKEANPYSAIMYHVFTDYIAAVDQRSKNMMVGFYLETDGSVRMYLNHLYDGDTILGSDNDCGLTIPAELDPNNDPKGYYQGHDSVLFVQLAKASHIWLQSYQADSDTADATRTITVAAVAKAMREQTLASGLRPFSPQGIEKYWVTDRLEKWPKLVSSYDGNRKYIENSKSSANYFFALHGLSIQRLREYVKTRFLFRDGFYKCGDTFTSAISMRCTGTNMSVTIKAAKSGYFGLGVDRANEANGGSCYLNAGETHTFYSNNTNLGGGVMLYLFGADRIEELDIRNATPKQQGWDISNLTLLKRLVIGGVDYKPATQTGDELATLSLGQLPFLEEIDVRNFPMKTIDATYCPRLKTVLAVGSQLQDFTPAKTSPISTLQLPDTMTSLTFTNLPNLGYPNGGLTIAGYKNVKRFQLSSCANIDTFTMLQAIVNGGAHLTNINISNLEVNADASILKQLMNDGTQGFSSDADYGCDGITGSWILTKLIDDAELSALQSYFKPQDIGLTVHNAQFTGVVFDDTVNDPKNITNLDNNSTGDTYEASGHMVRIREQLIPVKGKLVGGVWQGERLSDANYRQMYDGTDFDYKDELGVGFDVMMRCPHLWYKGVNDFKTQKKYIFWSSLPTEPISTARNSRRAKLSQCVFATNKAVQTTDAVVGTSTIDTDGITSDTPNYNVYRIDVSGMKQVRWPGLNHSIIGAVFTDASGIIVGKFNLAVSNSMFDFTEGDDYVFCDVPDGAKFFYFTSKNTNSEHEVIAVDSAEIEAIEPDWVENKPWLCGVYHASIDALMQMRSISGANVRVGTGTSVTSSEWSYDADGRVKNTPVGTLNYTYKDLQNLAMRRGDGFQLIDYEMSKLMAVLWMSLNGTRDVQLKCGYGRGSGGQTGTQDTVGNHDTARATASNGNKILGFENFVGCTWEVMDNVAVNVASFESYLKNHGVENATVDVINAKWHIYDPITKTERVVQGITSNGVCIGRVKHGRFCDIIASKCTSDSSQWAANYCDGQWYSASRCRVVGRSNNYAYAYGGLVYANAYNASSYSSAYNGSRLAFRGEIVISE
ncbi:MAG: hypothetical protein NC548_24435 [Lachnospiraceae bacterium]|nr:hypothetical protein [Lachnospiraceae bacterium]